jgi:hypothetical protein
VNAQVGLLVSFKSKRLGADRAGNRPLDECARHTLGAERRDPTDLQ